MRSILFTIFLALLLLGNCAGAYKLFTAPGDIMSQNPKVTKAAMQILRWLPIANVISLIGIFYWQKWAAILAILLGIVVVFFDVQYEIRHHIFVAVPSLLILGFFVEKYWDRFH